MIRACIANLRTQGAIDPARAKLFEQTFDELEATYKSSMSAAAAMAAATDQTVEAARIAIARKKRIAALKLTTRQQILRNIEGAGVPIDTAVLAHFDFDERVAGVSDIERRRRAVLGKAHGMMADILETFDRDLAGRVREPAQLKNLVREAFGEGTGDAAAREMAAAWGKAADYLRQRFNAAGGHIGKLDKWGMPQTHDRQKVKAAGFEAWRDAITPQLDLARMLDERTGKPFTAKRLNAALRNVYDGIITDGWDTRTLGARGQAMLANRRAENRFLIFKGADDWLQYQARFGAGDVDEAPDFIFDTMMSHLDGMSRDIAAMEVLGPDPNATVRWLGAMLDKAAATDALPEGRVMTAESKAQVARFQMDAMWGLFTGELNRPVNAQMARAFSTLRSLQTAAKLGGAVISAITDAGFQMTTRDFNGMPVARTLADYVQWMAPGVKAGEKAVAVRSGLLSEEAAGRMAALHRYQEEFNTPALAARLANGVLRVSGLSRWTQVGRWLFGMEYMGFLADNAGRAFANVDEGLRLRMQFYGITPADWDAIRATPAYEHQGARFLRPDDVAGNSAIPGPEAERLSDLLLEMIQSETRFAVPETSLRARAVTSGAARPGTLQGEGWRSIMQFKAFPVSIVYTHLLRGIYGKGAINRATYAAHLAIGTTVLGALAMQTKQVLAGKDPVPMEDPRFWGAAMAQGGGLGILGDFLLADQNRAGGGLGATLMGPLIGSIEGLAKLTIGNIQQLGGDGETNAGRELVRFLRGNTPGSSIWYLRTALDRIIWSNIQEMIDPDYDAAMRRLQRKAEREYGQGYWWAPDEELPDRAPDFANAIEGERQ